VTDFIAVWVWPVFNLADALVTIGIIGIVAMLVRESFMENGKKTQATKPALRSGKNLGKNPVKQTRPTRSGK
jgi:hypothetical protein